MYLNIFRKATFFFFLNLFFCLCGTLRSSSLLRSSYVFIFSWMMRRRGGLLLQIEGNLYIPLREPLSEKSKAVTHTKNRKNLKKINSMVQMLIEAIIICGRKYTCLFICVCLLIGNKNASPLSHLPQRGNGVCSGFTMKRKMRM